MKTDRLITLALLCVSSSALAQSSVKVDDTEVSFETEMTRQIGDQKECKLKLTGVALREKAWFNVYALGSYIDANSKVKTAPELAKADEAKLLDLVMEREVDGDDMGGAFKEAVRANHPKGFDKELKSVIDYFEPKTCKTGQHIRFIHLPKVGVRIEMTGQKELVIKGVKFANAIWDMYLGKENVGEDIKKGITKRLK